MRWFTRSTELEKLLVAVFCFIFPLGVRVTLWQFGEQFFPYNTEFLYVADGVAVLLVLYWIFSRNGVPQTPVGFYFWPAVGFLAFLVMGFVATLHSEIPLLGVLKLTRIGVFGLFAFLLAKRAAPYTSYITTSLFLSGFFQSILAIYQFATQHNIGLQLLGEQVLNPDLAGVAKIGISGLKLVRAYGTFPHPNILAAFLVLVIIICADAYLRGDDQRMSADTSCKKIVWQILWQVGMVFMGIALLLTFSRSGWIAFVIALFIASFGVFRRWKKKSSQEKMRLKALGILLGSVIVFAGLYVPGVVRSRVTFPKFEDQAMQARLSGLFLAVQMLQDHKLVGVGPGQFVFHMERFAGALPESWMYQPVHSLYALIASEYGLLGLNTFLFFIGFCLRARQQETHASFFGISGVSICFSFLILGLFDHYFFTFEQGMILWWLATALMLQSSRENTNSKQVYK